MNTTHKALLEMAKSTSYPLEVRAAAVQGLGFHGAVDVQKALIDIAKSTSYPLEVRAAAAKAAGQASKDEKS
jgi:HEAT repeat protein